VAHKADEEEAEAKVMRHHRGLFKCCRCLVVFSATFMIVSAVCSLLQRPPPQQQQQQQQQQQGEAGQGSDEEPNPWVGFLFAALGGFLLILALSALFKACRCLCGCLCGSCGAKGADDVEAGVGSDVTIDVPPPTPEGYTALPSAPAPMVTSTDYESKAAELTVHFVQAEDEPPKPLEAL
jgi:hypothetical protein